MQFNLKLEPLHFFCLFIYILGYFCILFGQDSRDSHKGKLKMKVGIDPKTLGLDYGITAPTECTLLNRN